MTDVAIIGAGPYGLACAVHLGAGGSDVAVYGEPMGFWERCMPVGMQLRSPYVASNIADPEGTLSLDAYKAASGASFEAPIPLEHFIDYGRWFQSSIAANLDRRMVRTVEPRDGGFDLTLADGDRVRAARVIVAAGIAAFAWRPPEFAGLPAKLVSHACDHRDPSIFAGRTVAVIGAGQSALESAALLSEAGANVAVHARATNVHWLARSARLHTLAPWLYAPTDVGPAGLSWLIAWPNAFRRIPRPLQERFAARAIRPAGAQWLRARLRHVPIATGRSVSGNARAGSRVRLRFSDATEEFVDHVLLATGYRVDISRYRFLPPSLRGRLRTINGYPVLHDGFESSLPGLHFVGAPAAWSFGPIMRFVAGTEFAGPALARRVAHRASAAPRVEMRPTQELQPS
jgi:NADPH-dependent 2,4-dienoyl-CoA reductase/sulfur reductase-like enzyme